VELLIVKYRRRKISISVTLISAFTGPEATFADRTTFVLTRRARENRPAANPETPDFIAATPWPANNPYISPVDYRIWGSVCTAAGFMTSPCFCRRVEIFQPDDQLIIDEAARQ